MHADDTSRHFIVIGKGLVVPDQIACAVYFLCEKKLIQPKQGTNLHIFCNFNAQILFNFLNLTD